VDASEKEARRAMPRRRSRPRALLLRAAVVALTLGALPVGLWLESARHTFLFLVVVLPLSLFLAAAGYVGARSILGTPQ